MTVVNFFLIYKKANQLFTTCKSVVILKHFTWLGERTYAPKERKK